MRRDRTGMGWNEVDAMAGRGACNGTQIAVIGIQQWLGHLGSHLGGAWATWS
ncbi:MAG TPA: hypothetical protein VJW20_11225 [Candidatus Angelobacter sp.]|nr:hypothetical protein [Candidatus Angelobacter sp.]